MPNKILIVDDEPDIRETLKSILKEKYKIKIAVDGKDCLKKLKREVPDLLLLDVMMPGMTTREILKEIRKNEKTKDLKIMLLTVLRISEAEKKGLLKEKNIVDFIQKPFKLKDLVKRVKKVI